MQPEHTILKHVYVYSVPTSCNNTMKSLYSDREEKHQRGYIKANNITNRYIKDGNLYLKSHIIFLFQTILLQQQSLNPFHQLAQIRKTRSLRSSINSVVSDIVFHKILQILLSAHRNHTMRFGKKACDCFTDYLIYQVIPCWEMVIWAIVWSPNWLTNKKSQCLEIIK